MTRRGLVGLFLLPLAFAALPLAAMAVSVTGGAGAEPPRIELVAPDQPAAAPIEVEELGFSISDHLASDCNFGRYDAAILNES